MFEIPYRFYNFMSDLVGSRSSQWATFKEGDNSVYRLIGMDDSLGVVYLARSDADKRGFFEKKNNLDIYLSVLDACCKLSHMRRIESSDSILNSTIERFSKRLSIFSKYNSYGCYDE